MRRLPAEPSSFMAGAPLVMYDGEWRAEEGEEWERVVRAGGDQGHGWEVDGVARRSRSEGRRRRLTSADRGRVQR